MKKVFIQKVILLASVMLGVLCLGYIGLYSYINIAHYTSAMEADVASEAVFVTSLYDNHFIEPDTWYESTACRLISSPNFAALIYPLVGENMNFAMGISCSLLMVGLAVVMLLYFGQIGLGVGGSLSALLLVFCLGSIDGESEKMLFLFASYYVSHFITMFLILMLYNRALKDGKVNNVIWITSLYIAFLNGIQGMHGCIFCYFPLIVTEVLRMLVYLVKAKRQRMSGTTETFLLKRLIKRYEFLLWTLAMTALSLFTTKIFGAGNVSTTRNLRHAPEKFVSVVWPLVCRVLNFQASPVLVTLLVAGAIAGYIWTIKRLLSDDRLGNAFLYWSTLAFPISLVLWIFLSTFTTFEAASRYYLSLLFAVSIGNGLLVSYLGAASVPVLAIIIVYGSTTLPMLEKNYIENDRSFDTDAYKAAAWMMENGYEYGYSTFDHANYITAMANDEVKVRAVNSMDDMEGCKWLTDSDWYPPVKSTEGATCYIVTPYLMEDFANFMNRYEPEVIEVGQADDYTIYVLDHDYTVWER